MSIKTVIQLGHARVNRLEGGRIQCAGKDKPLLVCERKKARAVAAVFWWGLQDCFFLGFLVFFVFGRKKENKIAQTF